MLNESQSIVTADVMEDALSIDDAFDAGEGVDEAEMAFAAAGAVTAERGGGHGAVVGRKFREMEARAAAGHSAAQFREITRIQCVERMISPSTGHGPATVQKFVVCVGVDNKLYVFQDTSEDAVRLVACTPCTTCQGSGFSLAGVSRCRSSIATTRFTGLLTPLVAIERVVQALNGYLHCLPSDDDQQRGHGHTAVRAPACPSPPLRAPPVLSLCLRGASSPTVCASECVGGAGSAYCGVLPAVHAGLCRARRPDLPVVAGHWQTHGRAVPGATARSASVPVPRQPHY